MSAYNQMALCPKRAMRRMCAEAFGIEEHRLVGAGRKPDVVIARQATYLVLRRRWPDMSFPRIGDLMGGRDHSTIISGIAAIERKMADDPALRQVVAALIKGRLPAQSDAHVFQWRTHLMREARREALAASLEGEAADGKLFCEQCDRALSIDEAARCESPFCGLQRSRQARLAA